jgi:hypothetical protein
MNEFSPYWYSPQQRYSLAVDEIIRVGETAARESIVLSGIDSYHVLTVSIEKYKLHILQGTVNEENFEELMGNVITYLQDARRVIAEARYNAKPDSFLTLYGAEPENFNKKTKPDI